MTSKEFAALLERFGFDFFTGVPCSLFEGAVELLEAHPRLPYLTAIREDAAVGVAAGAWFGGRQPAVLIQNSGLGTSLNALASLSLMYKLPCLLVVTWRGFGGKDAPEHVLMGEISPGLLDLLGIARRTLAPDSIADDLAWAAGEMNKRMEPVALLLPPKLLEPYEGSGFGVRGSGFDSGFGVRGSGLGNRENPVITIPDLRSPIPEPRTPLSRMEAMRQVLAELGDEPVIHANGYICRESFAIKDRPESFYMIGSMGLASAIGLGLALTSNRTVLVFDGDGNLLMNLGILAMVGSSQPKRFIHIVFDNEVYGSTGNQRSLSRDVRLNRLAAGAGYRRSAFVTQADQLRDATRQALTEEGPTFLLVKVNQAEAEVPRIPYSPETIRDRFRNAVKREE